MVGLVVSRRTSEPSAFMAKISRLPLRPLVKAICLPSGDQLGLLLGGPLVRRFMFLPSASAPKISWFLSRVLAQIIDLPSGDQRGASSKALCGTRFLCSVPSAFMTSSCSLPSVPCRRSYTKRIFLLSGDQ